jgi:hypothetical protein
MTRNGSRERPNEHGQIIVLFALMLSVLMILAALLYSGAQTLVSRRQLQNAGDAAALAAANLMENGTSLCNSTRISSSLSGNDLYVAAKNSVITNLGWTAAQVTSRMTLSCPSASVYGSVAVTVNLSLTGPSWFGAGGLQVKTASTGINGQTVNGDYSVALLDPSNSHWSNRTGCASYLVNGGVTVTYEGSIIVDSTCTLAVSTAGSIKAQNSAFSMTMINGSRLLTAGEVSAGTVSKITPTPIEHALPLQDPLGGLFPPCHTSSGSNCLGSPTNPLPAANMDTTGNGQCKSEKVVCVLSPGTYTGGLLAANGSGIATLLLRPGVYYIAGGGFQLKSGSGAIIAIPSATSGKCSGTATVSCTDAEAIARYCNPTNNNNGSCQLTTDTIGANWASDCPAPPATNTCGVLIYNAKVDANSAWVRTGSNADTVDNGSQGILLLRGYNPTYDSISGNGTTFASYKNLVMWQANAPKADDGVPQPKISMVGGACVVLSGTVYAPYAEVDFGGSSCGTGGGADAQMTLQFVCWDLTLSGNNNFYFAYRRNSLASPFAYGLVQ